MGYLLKDRVSDVEEFAAAVRRVGEGGSALDPTIVSQRLGLRRRRDPLAAITPRERQVLELMAEGRSNQGIAERLVITDRAAQKHATNIFKKLLNESGDDHPAPQPPTPDMAGRRRRIQARPATLSPPPFFSGIAACTTGRALLSTT